MEECFRECFLMEGDLGGKLLSMGLVRRAFFTRITVHCKKVFDFMHWYVRRNFY